MLDNNGNTKNGQPYNWNIAPLIDILNCCGTSARREQEVNLDSKFRNVQTVGIGNILAYLIYTTTVKKSGNYRAWKIRPRKCLDEALCM
ncbi:hypothetical protein NPIL_470871 [Nephila pilipes]|uniref:Uncharacterized protein n=1 Tax=Nephila pilipes TaxID=299642 RepID=A0A8X6QYD2_NEPPI|nr:hypothetical protein NPIL_470871 [Nephila pilipes]